MIKVDRTTAARAIKKLEIQGLIEKQPDRQNKKIKKLFTTEKGKKVYPFLKKEEEHSTKVPVLIFHLRKRKPFLNFSTESGKM